jgi:hypothetical protein
MPPYGVNVELQVTIVLAESEAKPFLFVDIMWDGLSHISLRDSRQLNQKSVTPSN